VLVVVGGRKVPSSSFINRFNLSSTKGQFLNSCSTCWQYAHVNAISTIGYGVVIDIFCWIGGYSTVPKTSILCQTPLVTCCVCRTICYEPGYKQVENYKTRQVLLIHQLVLVCWRVVPQTISFYNPEPY
jgi:hypothetical protein